MVDGDQAWADAQIPLNRLDLGLGLGTHPNDETIGYDVIVGLRIHALKAD